MVHQACLRGIMVRPLWKEGCPHRFGVRDWVDGCDLNEGRPCIYETAEAVQGCSVFREILHEIEEELQEGGDNGED